MAAPRVKTLLIGIGGVGGQIMSAAAGNLTVEDKRYVATVCLDTDADAVTALNKLGISAIQTSEDTTPSEYCRKHKAETEPWYPMNPYIAKQAMLRGAGQIRATSRLAFDAAQRANKLKTLEAAINNISLVDGTTANYGIRIMVVGSLAGGTGSGLLVQLPFYIRHLLKIKGYSNVQIRAIFLGADIFKDEQGDEYKEKSVLANSYAAIKELNALFRMQNVPGEDVPLTLGYYEPKKNADEPNDIPYDYVYLIEKHNNFANGLRTANDYINVAAQIVRIQFFTEIGQRVISNEDNTVEQLAETEGMSRFCGAGYSKAIYPYKEINEYCSLRWLTDTVNNSWMRFDTVFEVERVLRERERDQDPSLPPLKLSDEYIKLYTEAVKDNLNSRFAVLKRDSFVTGSDDIGIGGEDRAEVFADAVDRFIRASIATDELKKQSKKCIPDMARLKLRNEAAAAMQELLTAGNKYEEIIPQIATAAINSTVQSIIPSMSELIESADSEHSLPAILRTVHPISARYLLYRIQVIFDTKQRKCALDRERARLDGLREWDAIDGNDNEHDSPIMAINDKVYKNKDRYEEFIARFAQKAEEQVREYDSYRYNYFASKVYSVLLSRVKMLITIYEQLFKSIPEILAKKEKKIRTLESMHNSERQVECVFVLGSAEVKKKLYDSVRASLGITNDVQLEDSTKDNLFHLLFDRYCEELQIDLSDLNERLQAEKDRAAATRRIFDDSIVKDMLSKVKVRGNKILNIGIFNAMLREVELSHPERIAQNEYGETMPVRWSDVRQDIDRLYSRAMPLICYSASNSVGGKVYWGVHPELLERAPEYPDDIEKYDKAAAQEKLMVTVGAATETIADTSFSKNELVCYRTLYGLTAEDIITFGKEGEAHIAYAERINAIIRWEANQARKSRGFAREDKERIHPHIDKRWHLPAYLPSIYSDEANMDSRNGIRAFFLSIALEMCYKTDIDGEEVWRFRYLDQVTQRYVRSDIFKEGKRILPNYYALLQCMPYNTMLIDKVIGAYEEESEYRYDHRRVETIETDILEHDIILSFIGREDPKISASEGIVPVNVFDVLLNVFLVSGKNRDLLVGMLEELSILVTEYCSKMTTSSVSLKRTYRAIMTAVLEGSSIKTAGISDEDKLYFEDIIYSPAVL